MLTGIRWKRVILAAVLSEAGVIAVLLTVVAIYSSVIAPDLSDADTNDWVSGSAITWRRRPGR